MRMSAIKHPVRSCSPELRNSSADANAKEGKPADFIRPLSALRTSSSSSTIATTFGSSLEVTMPKNSAPPGITQLCFGIGTLGGWCKTRRSEVSALAQEPKPVKPSWTKLQPYFGLSTSQRTQSDQSGTLQLFSHFDEFGERAGLHLMHYLRAMHLDRDFFGSELPSNLLIEHARHHQCHDFVFSRGQPVVPLL